MQILGILYKTLPPRIFFQSKWGTGLGQLAVQTCPPIKIYEAQNRDFGLQVKLYNKKKIGTGFHFENFNNKRLIFTDANYVLSKAKVMQHNAKQVPFPIYFRSGAVPRLKPNPIPGPYKSD